MTIPTASEVWRDYATDGIPASGIYSPSKRDIRSWGAWLETMLSGAGGAGLGYATLALLNADVAHPANTLALVFTDTAAANNGLYEKSGASGAGSWTRIGDLPATIVPLTVTGGTADSIVATAPQSPLQPGSKLYLLVPTGNNTGAAMTITINGGSPTAIKNALAATPAANTFVNGIGSLLFWNADHYQALVSIAVDTAGVVADATAAATSASSSAAASAGYAAALGNQVRQYDTRAQASAATIPSGATLKITRYATGYPLAYATFIPGTSSGPMAFQDAGGNWWQLDVSGGVVDARWFGVKGDGSVDDATTIGNVRAYCVTNGLTLGFSDGVYKHNSTLTWAYPGFKVVALGSNVVFLHGGSGVAHNFNGLAAGDPSQGVFRGVFGGPNRFILKGNPAGGTTQLVYVNNWHQGDMKIRCRDAQYGFYGENTGSGQAAAVSSKFDVQVSSNGDGIPFARVPDVGMYLKNFFGCLFERCIVEQCGNNSQPGMVIVSSGQNVFNGGTVESCLNGGINMDSGSNTNMFQGMDLEANGAGYDVVLNGSNNIFQACTTGATALGSLIQGISNTFIGCVLNKVNNNGSLNTFNNCTLVSTFADSGAGTSVINPTGIATGSKMFFGDVHILSGSGAPSMVAEQGSLYLRKDGSSSSTRMYVNLVGSTSWTPVTTAS